MKKNLFLHKSIKSTFTKTIILLILITLSTKPFVIIRAASSPKLSRTSINLAVGKQYALTIKNSIKKSTFKWSSSNNKVATVTSKGLITAVGKGKATINCNIKAPSKNYHLTCKVTVTLSDKTDNPKVSITPTSTPATSSCPSVNTKTAIEVVKEMGYGTNLGNTMEATGSWISPNASATDYEKAWGQPTTTKHMIDGLKKSGFQSVRIPVAWSNMMSKDGNYTISPDYFKRVDEIIGYVLDNEMYAIINIHWDGGWWETFGSANKTDRDEAMKKYVAIWTQIADHYANYSDYLIFESANEELGDAFKEMSSVSDRYNKVNEINQKFVNIIRESGKNNKTRFLLIAGYNTDIDKTCDSRFVMPKDVIKNRLIVSVHFYTPPTYCIADKKDNSWGYMDSWGSEYDKKLMRAYFEKMNKFTKDGYGVIIGEYGVTHREDGSTKQGTAQFFESVIALANEYNYCAMLWDCSTWYDRKTAKITDPAIAAIYQ